MLDQTERIDFQTRALLLIAAALVFRLVYAAFVPVNPAGDEAYYWDWSRRLDYGYYSKPPFIAWLYALVDWIGGGSLFAIRATAAVLGTVSIFFMFRLAGEMFDQRTGWLAAVLALATPANTVLSYFLTIDAPLVFFWSAALWMFWRYVSGTGGWGSLLALFLVLGLGHLCKQMMMVFPLLAIAFLGLSSETRPLFRRGPVWLVLLGSYLSLTPPLVWNARHDWITFRHTGHHFETTAGDGNAFLTRVGDFFTFLGTQMGVLSPIVGIALLSLTFVGLFAIRKAEKPVRFLLVFGALPLLVIFLLALRQELQPNWPAVFYISGYVLTAAWYAGRFDFRFPPQRWTRFFPLAIVLGLVLVGYFYASPIVFKALDKAGHKADPTRRFTGYDVLAEKFDVIRSNTPGGKDRAVVMLGHRDLTSQMAFALPDRPRVYRWEPYDRITSQYELWSNPIDDGFAGKDAWIVVPNEDRIRKRFENAFEEIEKVDEFEVFFGYDRLKHFSIWHGKGLKEWPKGEALEP